MKTKVTIMLDNNILQDLKILSKLECRTLPQQIRYILQLYLDERKQEQSIFVDSKLIQCHLPQA